MLKEGCDSSFSDSKNMVFPNNMTYSLPSTKIVNKQKHLIILNKFTFCPGLCGHILHPGNIRKHLSQVRKSKSAASHPASLPVSILCKDHRQKNVNSKLTNRTTCNKTMIFRSLPAAPYNFPFYFFLLCTQGHPTCLSIGRNHITCNV